MSTKSMLSLALAFPLVCFGQHPISPAPLSAQAESVIRMKLALDHKTDGVRGVRYIEGKIQGKETVELIGAEACYGKTGHSCDDSDYFPVLVVLRTLKGKSLHTSAQVFVGTDGIRTNTALRDTVCR